MKKLLSHLLTLLLLGFGAGASAQEFSEDDLHDMGVKKADVIDQIVHFSDEQKSKAVFIIMKYDDLSSTLNNVQFAITPQAERGVMATLDEARLAVYQDNIDKIHENLIKAYAKSPAVPAPASNGKKRRTK